MPLKVEAIETIAPQPVLDGISIYELDSTTCHFPLDGLESRPPFTYCGKPTRAGGSSWCEAHYKRVYSGGRW